MASRASCGGWPDASAHLRHPAGFPQRDRAVAPGRERQGQSRTPAASFQRRRCSRPYATATSCFPFCMTGSTATCWRPIRSSPPSPRNRSRRTTSMLRRQPGARIPVTVVPPIVAEATADLTFGLMLAVARRMVEGDRLVHRGRFPGAQSSHLVGAAVYGKTIGLVGGGGRIGACVGPSRPRLRYAGSLLVAAPQARGPRAGFRHDLCSARSAAPGCRFRVAAFAATACDPAPDRCA